VKIKESEGQGHLKGHLGIHTRLWDRPNAAVEVPSPACLHGVLPFESTAQVSFLDTPRHWRRLPSDRLTLYLNLDSQPGGPIRC
jgi:hypothetical protein